MIECYSVCAYMCEYMHMCVCCLFDRESLSGFGHALETGRAAGERAPHKGPVLILIFNHSINVCFFNNSLYLHQSFLSFPSSSSASQCHFFPHCLLRWKHEWNDLMNGFVLIGGLYQSSSSGIKSTIWSK